jgi:hypothetical protein
VRLTLISFQNSRKIYKRRVVWENKLEIDLKGLKKEVDKKLRVFGFFQRKKSRA